jgi:hypothetical protein
MYLRERFTSSTHISLWLHSRHFRLIGRGAPGCTSISSLQCANFSVLASPRGKSPCARRGVEPLTSQNASGPPNHCSQKNGYLVQRQLDVDDEQRRQLLVFRKLGMLLPQPRRLGQLYMLRNVEELLLERIAVHPYQPAKFSLSRNGETSNRIHSAYASR